MNKVQVSIVCNTYNQVNYVEDALKGFVFQKTNFPYEILIHDDASTDGTQDIIKKYEKKYPELIKPIYESENQYSKGVKISPQFQYPRAQGKYIAFCEGDDFWIDPLKLQKQYDAMETHPELDMCAHKSKIMDATTGRIISLYAAADRNCVIPADRFIYTRGERVVDSATLFYRKSLFHHEYAFTKVHYLDYTLKIQGSLRGGILYLNDCMSVYRFLSQGSWTLKHEQDSAFWHNLSLKRKESLLMLDKETNYKFHDSVLKEIKSIEVADIYKYGDCKQLFDKKYRDEIKQYGTSWKVKAFVKSIIPYINKRKNIM
jgi:glycosyltransferase involved in cell wall biosynthesis